MIFKQIYLTHGTITGTTTPGQYGPGSNDNEEFLKKKIFII